MSFSNYKKTRLDLTNLNKKVDEIATQTAFFKDSRFWRATLNKEGSGSARIRFLPAAEGEDLPWVQYHEHNFSIDGNYFKELCPTTLGRECPVCKANSILWKTEIKENQAIVSLRKRKWIFISNILVLKDKENPDNEGKVFLLQYGQKIHEKILAALKSTDEEEPSVNVFDFWEGADFSLDIKKVKNFNNYDDSKFRAPSALLGGVEKELELIYNQLYPLLPFKDEKKFKPYDELEKKFNEVVSGVKGKIQKKADELFPEKEPTEPKEKLPDTAADLPWSEPSAKASKKNAEKTPVKQTEKKPTKGKVKPTTKKKTSKKGKDVETENDELNAYESLVEDD